MGDESKDFIDLLAKSAEMVCICHGCVVQAYE
jgi:hypothetical protein